MLISESDVCVDLVSEAISHSYQAKEKNSLAESFFDLGCYFQSESVEALG